MLRCCCSLSSLSPASQFVSHLCWPMLARVCHTRARPWWPSLVVCVAKPSHCGLVLGLSCQTAMLGGGRWWWCVSFDVAAVTDICVRKHKQREGVDAENTKRSAMPNKNGVQWWWWWWWCVKVFVVTGIMFTNMSGEVGLGPKTPTEPLGSVLGCACIPSAERGCCIHTATPPGVK